MVEGNNRREMKEEMSWDVLQVVVYKDDNASYDVIDDKECDQLVLICCLNAFGATA